MYCTVLYLFEERSTRLSMYKIFTSVGSKSSSDIYHLSLGSSDLKINKVVPKTHRRQGSGTLRHILSPSTLDEKGKSTLSRRVEYIVFEVLDKHHYA